MGLFQKLFGKTMKDGPKAGGTIALTPDQFLQTEYVKNIAAKYQKTAVVLHPASANQPLYALESKFGGTSNLKNFESYPCCDACGTRLNFVLQLYQRDFPTHYWPGGKNLFQLFRCPYENCPEAYSDPADHKMFVFYFEDQQQAKNEIPIYVCIGDDYEEHVRDCRLNPEMVADYPQYEDFDGVIADIEKKYGETLSEVFTDTFTAIQRTKSAGYPSFTQSSYAPLCGCGKPKTFFFQLSSDDTVPDVSNPGYTDWSPHGIMIGDVGNIYFYVCRDCGEPSIQSYWDCH